MLIDSTGLGYTIRRGEILVHYPTRTANEAQRADAESGTTHHYGVGWPIGPVPSWYAESPPNAITAERVKLWAQLTPAEDSAEE